MIVSYPVAVYLWLSWCLKLVLATSILFIHFIGVIIGFNITEYSVSEGAGSVSAIVDILSGTLARSVHVTVFTSTDSAGGRNDMTKSSHNTIDRSKDINLCTDVIVPWE